MFIILICTFSEKNFKRVPTGTGAQPTGEHISSKFMAALYQRGPAALAPRWIFEKISAAAIVNRGPQRAWARPWEQRCRI